MTMSDSIFECLDEMERYRKDYPEMYNSKEFQKKYKRLVKEMDSFARWLVFGENIKDKNTWKKNYWKV